LRTFVTGDIHGAYKALIQCLERSGFDYDCDQLIQVGDVADGHPQVYECVEELLKIKHLTALKGNHDDWLDEFIKTDFHPYSWNYGGKGTLISYLEHAGKSGRFFAKGSGYKTALESNDIPETHKAFFNSQKLYYIDNNNKCFVHAGFKRELPFLEQKITDYYWDRSLWQDAVKYAASGEDFTMVPDFKEIYIGHTQTIQWEPDKPLQAFNIYNVDTGTGGSGRLTIMDIDTKEYWQSDLTLALYGNLTEHKESQSLT
jgi:serine/threonine protein phosphatase 1